ncbi:MAG: GNAT family N-acetyltransferase [Ferrovibrio sp.]|uniref:GNAT family N-acetyltransferase n=1 Tax=Ferrovibrio sp. TaxID=1917215 RepID=UPI00391C4493
MNMQLPLSVSTVIPAARSPRSGWQCVSADGRFEVRLTRSPEDIAAAQRLRYQVFYEEMAAEPSPEMAKLGLDFDQFDRLCDHLMVFDRSRAEGEQAVGTYRLLRRSVAEMHGGFYSASEYDLKPMLDYVGIGGGLLELGRSCVHRDYRTNATIQLLWRGISTYVSDHNISFMFGCASFPGINPQDHALALSYLHAHHLPPQEWRVRALPDRYTAMDLMPADQINPRAAVHALPPLIKAYLRLGAYIGDGAVVDHQFGTTDVFILLPVERIAPKYHNRFSPDEGLVQTEYHA